MVIIVGVRHVIRVTVGLLVALSLSIPPVGVTAAAPAHDASVDLAVAATNGRLTVDVRNAPLALVLRIIGEQAGVEVALRGDLSAPVTEAFAGLPFEEGVRRLARGHSVVISYGPPTGESGPAPVTGVRIIAAAPTARSDDATTSHEAKSPPLGSRPGTVSERQVDPSGLTGDSSLASRIVEIQAFSRDAGLGSEGAMSRLVEIAASDADAGVREQAVAELARLTGPATEPALVSALADTAVEVRIRAIRGLRTFGTDTAAQWLANALIGDADPQVRLTALAAVGSLSGPRMLTMLEKASADPNVTVRETALRWLAWWRSRVPATP